MKTIFKFAAAAALSGALALAATTPSEARGGRNAAAAGVGFVAGALLGAATANSGFYGGPGYYGSGYYGPGPYGYGPGPYAGPYAYEPAPVYVAPRRAYRGGDGGCWIATDTTRGYGYYGPCY
jgi:hypothetical protein